MHRAACEWAKKISSENRVGFATWKGAQAAGYVACGKCKPDVEEVSGSAVDAPFVGNRNSKILHRAGCEFAKKISPANRAGFKLWKEAEAAGFTACGGCRPDAAQAGAESSSPATTPAAGELCASSTGKTFHKPECAWAKKISGRNLVVYKTRDDAIASGKTPCKVCTP
jgi:methylphosphotriester-DNA--protein-cysteine methyltransferase